MSRPPQQQSIMNQVRADSVETAIGAHDDDTGTTDDPEMPADADKTSFYAVRQGRDVRFCIFLRWEDCQCQVQDCLEAEYSVFVEWQEAVDYVKVVAGSSKTSDPTTNPSTIHQTRKRKPTATTNKPAPPSKRQRGHQPLHETLVQGYQQCRGKGWRCADLGLTFREPHKKTAQAKYLQDLAELRGTLAVGTPPLELTPAEKRTIQNQSDHTILGPFSIRYLNHAWGVNRKYHNDMSSNDKATEQGSTPFTSCTIECRQAARMRYTAKKLFLNHRVDELTNESKLYSILDNNTDDTTNTNNNLPTTKPREQKRLYQHQAAQEWEQLSQSQKQHWEQQAIQHDQVQPTIEPKLIALLQKEPQRSTAKLVEDIGFWCGRTTISKWRLRWEQRKRKRGKKSAGTNTGSNTEPRDPDSTDNSAQPTDLSKLSS